MNRIILIQTKLCFIIYRVRKILNTRLFEGDNGKRWHLSAKDAGLEILCISQVSYLSIFFYKLLRLVDY